MPEFVLPILFFVFVFCFSDLKCHLCKMYSYFRDVSISELDLQLSFPIFSCQILILSICTRTKWIEDCAHVFCSIEPLVKYWPDFFLDCLVKQAYKIKWMQHFNCSHSLFNDDETIQVFSSWFSSFQFHFLRICPFHLYVQIFGIKWFIINSCLNKVASIALSPLHFCHCLFVFSFFFSLTVFVTS